MIVTRSEVRPFQQDELDLMKGFADQAVIAIENARLVSELRESYRVVQEQAGKLETQSQELVKLNQQLEQRVADQVGAASNICAAVSAIALSVRLLSAYSR